MISIKPIKTKNAITRRIDLLQNLWDAFIRSTESGCCCCWSVLQEERSMIDTFFQVNAHESSDTPDIFLKLESPFTNINTYGELLSQELATLIDADREDLAADGIFIDWQIKYRADSKNHAVGFLREFFHFAHSIELEEGKVIAFLAPASISNPKAWNQWWKNVLTLNIPDQMLLMVCEEKQNRGLTELTKAFPDKIKVFSPDLKMNDAIRELMSEYGDQEDGCTHFRKAYFELTQAVGAQDGEQIKHWAKKSLALARQIGFPHLEVTVLCTTGNGFMMSGKTHAGITAFDEALKIADLAKDKPLVAEMPDLKIDLPGGNLFEQLAVQVLFFKAAGFLSSNRPDYEQALEAYQTADDRLTKMLATNKTNSNELDWTNGGIIHFHRSEALRMTGYCSEKLGRHQEALKIYTRAVSLAEKMSPEMRQSTMLSYVGQAMLNICGKNGEKKKYWRIQEKMEELLGVGWADTEKVLAN